MFVVFASPFHVFFYTVLFFDVALISSQRHAVFARKCTCFLGEALIHFGQEHRCPKSCGAFSQGWRGLQKWFGMLRIGGHCLGTEGMGRNGGGMWTNGSKRRELKGAERMLADCSLDRRGRRGVHRI